MNRKTRRFAMVTTLKPTEAIVPAGKDEKYDYGDDDDKNVPEDDHEEVVEDEDDAVGEDEDDDERKDGDKCEDDELQPIHHMSKKTTEAERKNSSYELEVQAIVDALKKFRVYLLGSKFKVVTDCSAFQKTMEKKDLATRVERWTMLLEGEISRSFEKEREELRQEAETQIQKAQEEKGRTYDSRRRKPQVYDVDDLVAEKRTQFDPGAMLKLKFRGPYRIVKAKQDGTYDVSKKGSHEDPHRTTTCSEYLKKWVNYEYSSEADEVAGRPSCGICAIGSGLGCDRWDIRTMTAKENEGDGDRRVVGECIN